MESMKKQSTPWLKKKKSASTADSLSLFLQYCLHFLSSKVMTILNFIFITLFPFKNVASCEGFPEKMYLAFHVLRIYKNVYYFDDFFLPTSYF